MMTLDEAKIAVVGLGYVGLPLAVAFGRVFDTLGFDIKEERIAELRQGRDSTLEVEPEALAAAERLRYTSKASELESCNIYVVAVPTPVDAHRRPDISMLRAASRTVGQVLSPGDVVIYESTVYPGATEEDCVPVLEEVSGLRFNEDFFVGYSPERINPGDKEHRFETIVKVTAGSTPESAQLIDAPLRLRRRSGHSFGPLHPGGRGGQGHREHPTRREHRSGQRAGHALPPPWARHLRGPRGGQHQVELLAFSTRPRRWPLHRHRSLLPDPQS